MKETYIYQLVYIDGMDSRPYLANVGKNGVTEIEEHPAAGEGDKWFYDIHFDSGEILRTFKVEQAVRKPKA